MVAGSPQCGSQRLDPIAMMIPLGCARVGKRVGVGFQSTPLPLREWPGEGLGVKLVITLGTKDDHFHDAMLGDYRPRAKRFDGAAPCGQQDRSGKIQKRVNNTLNEQLTKFSQGQSDK